MNIYSVFPGIRFLSFLIVILFQLIQTGPLYGQMISVVNSNADDEFAHPHDKSNTMEDESMDGFCEDSLGRCTLRAALEEAASLGLGAYVTFSGERSIIVSATEGPLYPPDNSRVIGQGNALISSGGTGFAFIVGSNSVIQGIDFYNSTDGLLVAGDHNLIGGSDEEEGNIFTSNSQAGIQIAGNNNVVKGNLIGIDKDNTGNSNLVGIHVVGSENTIGGLTPGEKNVISGNNIGISVYTLSGNTYILGNYIGTDTSSTQAIPNRVGIDIIGPNVTVGGVSLPEKNVISGNLESGVLVGIAASDIAILGNHIGVDISGVEVVPNRDGIILGPGSFSAVVEGNEIVSNTNAGIFINGFQGQESQHHKIRGNTIELNGIAGIVIQGEAVRNIIGSSTTQDFAPNVIQFNGAAGVAHVDFLGTPTENTIRKNSFRDNGILGIDNCTACQDAIDPPVILSYTDLGLGVATITGTHPTHSSIIDVYVGEINTSGVYEGKQWIGSGFVNANGDFLVTADPCDCDTIVATVTNPAGSTSQFSNGFPATITAVRGLSSDNIAIVAYPNPFNKSATIQWELEKPGHVSLIVSDIHGNEIETLTHDYFQAGRHQVQWNASGLAGGVYYYQFNLSGYPLQTGKLIHIGF